MTASWSLAGRLRLWLFVLTLLITVIASAIVAIHYGYGTPELRQRAAVELVEDLERVFRETPPSADLAATIERRMPIFRRLAGAYDWAIADEDGDLVSSSEDSEINKVRFQPVTGPASWIAPCQHGGWEAGRRVQRNGATWQVAVVAHSDPAGVMNRVLLGEAAIHVLLPLAPFAALSALLILGVVGRSMRPLKTIAAQARRVQDLSDIRPLDSANAPAEVTELVDALNAALAALNQAVAREQAFLQDASHALRTPLAALAARLELEGDNIDHAQLRQDVQSLIRLTTQLLASANAERLVIRSDRQVRLDQIAEAVVIDMSPLAANADVDLGLEVAVTGAGAVAVPGDADAIAHALKNLVDNAIRHSPRGGGVTVSVSASPPAINVSDSGPGIPPARLARIFERHSRDSFGGSGGAGLGLSIVRRIVEAHGGTLSAANTEPGAVLTITFPQPASA